MGLLITFNTCELFSKMHQIYHVDNLLLLVANVMMMSTWGLLGIQLSLRSLLKDSFDLAWTVNTNVDFSACNVGLVVLHPIYCVICRHQSTKAIFLDVFFRLSRLWDWEDVQISQQIKMYWHWVKHNWVFLISIINHNGMSPLNNVLNRITST